jgi:hypothetical protein
MDNPSRPTIPTCRDLVSWPVLSGLRPYSVPLCGFVLVLLAILCTTARGHTNKPFGEYYLHTRWIDRETRSIQVDAYPDRLVITRKGKREIVHGCWRGRAFLQDCRWDYFLVAYEGRDAGFVGGTPLEEFHFRRVLPDPKA